MGSRPPSPVRSSALEENVQAIKRWEKTILLARSMAEQISDWIACTAGSGPFLLLHFVWREMTAVLQLLQDIAQHLAVQTSVTPEQLRDLMKKTDLRRLTNRLEELAEPDTAALRGQSDATPEASNAAS